MLSLSFYYFYIGVPKYNDTEFLERAYNNALSVLHKEIAVTLPKTSTKKTTKKKSKTALVPPDLNSVTNIQISKEVTKQQKQFSIPRTEQQKQLSILLKELRHENQLKRK